MHRRSAGHDLLGIRPVPAQGNIAQQIFWYTAFTADMVKPGLARRQRMDGTPKWRMAPSPHGVYWKDGMKLGYQDVGSWTLMKSTPDRSRQGRLALCAVRDLEDGDVKKSHVGLTFIRESTIRTRASPNVRPKLGGLIEFYRSPARVQWSPTGTNVPDYPKLAQLWWQAHRRCVLRCEDRAGSHGLAVVARNPSAEARVGELRLTQ
jgi:glycerol transport system substrate-binding protein